jgi:hypothetical protein
MAGRRMKEPFEVAVLKNLRDGKKYVVKITGGNVCVLGTHEETKNINPAKLEEELRKYAAGPYSAAHKIIPKRTFTRYSGKMMEFKRKHVEPSVAKIFVYKQVAAGEKKSAQKFFEEYHKILKREA